MTMPKFPKSSFVSSTRKAAADPLKPEMGLLMKLGSIIVHTEEMLSPSGHPVDKAALQSLLDDVEVRQWIRHMGVYLPLKR